MPTMLWCWASGNYHRELLGFSSSGSWKAKPKSVPKHLVDVELFWWIGQFAVVVQNYEQWNVVSHVAPLIFVRAFVSFWGTLPLYSSIDFIFIEMSIVIEIYCKNTYQDLIVKSTKVHLFALSLMHVGKLGVVASVVSLLCLMSVARS